MTILDKQNMFITSIKAIKTWYERYIYLSEISYLLPKFNVKRGKIINCVSNSFFLVKKLNNKLIIEGSSESKIISGIIFMLYSIYNKESIKNVKKSDKNFLNKISIYENISMTRGSSIKIMIERIYS